MHTLIFTENYTAGGLDRVTRLLVDHFASQPSDRVTLMINGDCELEVLESTPLPSNVEKVVYNLLTPARITRKGHKQGIAKFESLFWRTLGLILRYPLMLLSIPYFAGYFRHHKVDQMIVNNGGYPGGEFCRSMTLAASFSGLEKILHVFHSIPRNPDRGLLQLKKFLDRKLEGAVSHMVAVSHFTAEKLLERRSFERKPEVIHNGLDCDSTSRESKDDDQGAILHVGYFDENKNQKDLVEAISLLSIPHPLVFLGRDEKPGAKAEVQRLVRDLSLEQSVRFEGFVDPEQHYRKARMLVLCSKIESFPMVVLEAMSCGLPVVSYEVGGVGEQIEDGKTGFLVPPGDVKILAERIERLLEDDDLCKTMGKAAGERFERDFGLESMLQKYHNLLNSQ